MNETTPPSLPSDTPKKSKTWVIVVVAIVVLCCFCIGIIGLIFAFYDPILNALGLAAAQPILALLA